MNFKLIRTFCNCVSISPRHILRLVSYEGLGILLLFFSSACQTSEEESVELLIGIKSEYIPLLVNSSNPDPTDTGISSLDKLNADWEVQEMKPVFPDVSPDDEAAQRTGLSGIFKLTVAVDTDIDAMLAEYKADQHVEYVELNKPVEINWREVFSEGAGG